MVIATTSETSSTELIPGERNEVSRGKGKEGISFAAILLKALSGPAAPEKSGKEKVVSRAERKGEESPPRPQKLTRSSEKSGKNQLEVHDSLQLPIHPEDLEGLILAASAVVPSVSIEDSVKLIRNTATHSRNPAADGTQALHSAVRHETRIHEGTLPAGDKTNSDKTNSLEEKKPLMKQKTTSSQRKESAGDETSKKTESADNAVLVRDARVLSREDAKQESAPRQEIEIRVSVRNADERFEDTLRTSDERSVKESASGLLRRLREDANSDIVKSARFILKDAHEGEIRLVLKPESLGEVKIRLFMQDNIIAGRIFVENESVRSAFEQNMQDLMNAFKQNGMQLGSLDVSVGSGENQKGENREAAFAAYDISAEKEVVASSIDTEAYYFISHMVNVMA